MKLVIATKNKGKIKEFRKKLSAYNIEVIPLTEFPNIPDAPETGDTFLENCYQKATFYSNLLKLPALSDDSGLEVEALNGLPGVKSSRFAGENATDRENLEKLIEELKRKGLMESKARFRCFIFLSFPENYGLWSEGILYGKVTTEPKGEKGFGYDPIFIPEGERRTLAQIDIEEKNKISHRAKAIEKLLILLGKLS